MNDLSQLPRPGQRRVALHVKPAAERSLRAGHPWLFENSITRQSHEGKPGDQAVVYDRKDRFLAIGLYDPHSPIRVRLLAHNQPQPISSQWFRERLDQSLEARSSFDSAVTSGYRLVHGENDGFPGLVLDRYDRVLVLKLYSTAWVPYLEVLLPLMLELAEANRLVLRLSRNVQYQEEALHGLMDGQLLLGPPLDGPVQFIENGLIFEADLVKGHKTGFYLDQRENRTFLEKTVKQVGGINHLLNLFSYTGGFSIYAARGGTSTTTNVDISQAALNAAGINIDLNESHVLNDMYDAEVRYQDDYLGQLFEALGNRRRAKDTLTVIVSDHGDGLGEHNRFGHAFVAYQELVRVPMILQWPDRFPSASRSSNPVSTRRIYHTILEAAGPLPQVDVNLDPAEVHGLTLLASNGEPDPENGLAFSEIYPPLNYAKAIRHRHPELLELYRCLAMRRTIVSENLKLIQVGDQAEELFDITNDPLELNNIIADQTTAADNLNQEINQLIHLTEAQRDNLAHGQRIDMEVDEKLLNHLRGLGYIE